MAEVRVKEQEVSLLELFYDLIYVYAIARMTAILADGGLMAQALGRYMATSLLVLQSWMYMTNYVNRFGRERGYESVGIVLNMAATVVLANTISLSWEIDRFSQFNVALIINLGVVFVLYARRSREGGNARATALYSMRSLAPAIVLYAVALAISRVYGTDVAFWLDVAAILVGIFLPAFIRTRFDTSIISFPHLVERFELLTIITFGESITTVAEYFERYGMGPESALVFGAIVLLFGAYVRQVHELVEHHANQRALLLIYGHFLLVTCLNLLTVCLNLALGADVLPMGVRLLAVAALVGFVLCLMLMGRYYPRGFELLAIEKATIVVATCVGVAAIAGVPTVTGLLAGLALCGGGMFAALSHAAGRIGSRRMTRRTSMTDAGRDGARTVAYRTENLYAKRDGMAIYGVVHIPELEGSGKFPTVIFSHGFGGSFANLEPYARRLASCGYATYSYDFIGGSTGSMSGGSMLDMSLMTEREDLLAVLEMIREQPFVDTDHVFLAGASQGGAVSAITAPQVASQVAGLILFYPALVIVDHVHATFATLDEVPATYSIMGMRVGRRYATDVWDLDTYGEIAAYEGDVLIVHGDRDSIVPVGYSEHAAEVYRHAELHVIKGAGHGFHSGQRRECLGYVLDFLARHVEP